MKAMQYYRLFMEEHLESSAIQIDSVEGLSTNRMAILTILRLMSGNGLPLIVTDNGRSSRESPN